MAPTANNAWTLSTGIQSAKGTPNATGHMKQTYTGGFGPRANRNMITLAETDASRQEGNPIVVGIRVEGDSEHYLRPDQFHRDAHLLMGQTSTTGTTNYTHTATQTADGSAAYATLIRALNATTLVDQYSDMQLSSMTVRGTAEQVITYTKTWLGGTPLFGATDTALTASTLQPYVYPEVTVTKNSITTDAISGFELTVSNNRTLIIADTGFSAAFAVAGTFQASGSMTIVFESDADWRAFQTGSTTGTTAGTTLYQQPLAITMVRDVNTSVTFNFTNIILTAYDPPGGTDGAPISVGATFRTARAATAAAQMSIVTKNQVATPLA